MHALETALSEFLLALSGAGGLSAIVTVLLILRGWSASRALVLLLATITAIVTTKKERREACISIVKALTSDDEPWYRAILPWHKSDDDQP